MTTTEQQHLPPVITTQYADPRDDTRTATSLPSATPPITTKDNTVSGTRFAPDPLWPTHRSKARRSRHRESWAAVVARRLAVQQRDTDRKAST